MFLIITIFFFKSYFYLLFLFNLWLTYFVHNIYIYIYIKYKDRNLKKIVIIKTVNKQIHRHNLMFYDQSYYINK